MKCAKPWRGLSISCATRGPPATWWPCRARAGRPELKSEAIEKRLKGLHPQRIDLSLGRIKRLLRALDCPQRNLPPVIHIAGTNGKGSTLSFMAAAMRAAGLHTHIYTSPHLVRFNERIRPGGRAIADARLSALLHECETANDGKPITFFEMTTAAAFLAFARSNADYTLLETGLGGRLDATNVVARPRVCVITPVSLDHQHFLGNRLDLIAREKAGILKRGTPAVIAPQHARAAKVISARAKQVGSPLVRGNHDFTAREDDGALVYEDKTSARHFPLPVLKGAHQITNAAAAIAALDALKDPRVNDTHIARGLEKARWPARLQRLETGRLAAPLARRGFELWVDGGHNPGAGRALAQSLASWRDRPLYLVLGQIDTKDTRGFLKPLAPLARSLWAVPVAGHAARPVGRIVAISRDLGLAAHEAAGLKDALGQIGTRKAGRVLVAGSLYLAGEVLGANGTRV